MNPSSFTTYMHSRVVGLGLEGNLVKGILSKKTVINVSTTTSVIVSHCLVVLLCDADWNV